VKQGPNRNLDFEVLTVATVTVPTFTWLAAFGHQTTPADEFEQRARMVVGNEDHIAAIATITAIWAAPGDKLLPTKT
jgi:hypothetical protein